MNTTSISQCNIKVPCLSDSPFWCINGVKQFFRIWARPWAAEVRHFVFNVVPFFSNSPIFWLKTPKSICCAEKGSLLHGSLMAIDFTIYILVKFVTFLFTIFLLLELISVGNSRWVPWDHQIGWYYLSNAIISWRMTLKMLLDEGPPLLSA